MKSDKNGVSTCPPGYEQYEIFKIGKKRSVQYDYRDSNGDLFSTVAPSLTACRARRDHWLKRKIS